MLHKFTTVESYTVSLVFHHPLTLSFQALKNLPFLQILPTAGQTTWIPQTFTVTSEHTRFYFLVFLFYTF